MQYCCELLKHHIHKDIEQNENFYIIKTKSGVILFPIQYCPFCGSKMEIDNEL